MEKLKLDISKYQKKEEIGAKYEFQNYVLKTIEEFGVVKPYDQIIWRWSKRNISFLRGRVENLRESAKTKGEDLKGYGRLLIWTLKQK